MKIFSYEESLNLRAQPRTSADEEQFLAGKRSQEQLNRIMEILWNEKVNALFNACTHVVEFQGMLP